MSKIIRLAVMAVIFAAAARAQAEDLVVLGRLKAIDKAVPACGTIHFGSVAEYEVTRVMSGSYDRKAIFVVHDCVEMPRSRFSKDAGTVASFAPGDVHRLVLVRENVRRIEVFDARKIPASFEPYFCKRADDT